MEIQEQRERVLVNREIQTQEKKCTKTRGCSPHVIVFKIILYECLDIQDTS
jgi:hypothetical protein